MIVLSWYKVWKGVLEYSFAGDTQTENQAQMRNHWDNSGIGLIKERLRENYNKTV